MVRKTKKILIGILIMVTAFSSTQLVTSCGSSRLCAAYDTQKKGKPAKGWNKGGRQKWQ